MSSGALGLIIEFLVVVLLITTIGYCMVLNSRLKALRADEHLLKATIGELLAATEVAERAIIGLKATTREAEAALGQKLRDAQTLRQELPSSPPRPAQTAAPIPPMPARAAPPVPVPTRQQVASAMRGLEEELTQIAAPQDAPPQRDFRMFTRTSCSSRNG